MPWWMTQQIIRNHSNQLLGQPKVMLILHKYVCQSCNNITISIIEYNVWQHIWECSLTGAWKVWKCFNQRLWKLHILLVTLLLVFQTTNHIIIAQNYIVWFISIFIKFICIWKFCFWRRYKPNINIDNKVFSQRRRWCNGVQILTYTTTQRNLFVLNLKWCFSV